MALIRKNKKAAQGISHKLVSPAWQAKLKQDKIKVYPYKRK